MEQPLVFIQNDQERKVYKLKRSIYGLKQSSRQLYLRFHRAITPYDFNMINEDHCVYMKWYHFVIFSFYMDNILLAENSFTFVKVGCPLICNERRERSIIHSSS